MKRLFQLTVLGLRACGVSDPDVELLSGMNFNQHIHDFADPIERELWDEFKADMSGATLSGWIGQGASAPAGRPADLGYYVGYKISEAFYQKAPDKARALSDLFNVSDYAQLLVQSGYAGGN